MKNGENKERKEWWEVEDERKRKGEKRIKRNKRIRGNERKGEKN